MHKSILILNGPGLSDLSDYEGISYGVLSLPYIEDTCSTLCARLQMQMEFRQTDDQETMMRWLMVDGEEFDALIINPIGYSRANAVEFERYRSAINTIAFLKKPVVEVHITNIFRDGAEITKPLHTPDGEMGFVCGLGVHSYTLAIKAVTERLCQQVKSFEQVRINPNK